MNTGNNLHHVDGAMGMLDAVKFAVGGAAKCVTAIQVEAPQTDKIEGRKNFKEFVCRQTEVLQRVDLSSNGSGF